MKANMLGSELIIVKESKIQGRGVYARDNIAKGTRIIEYLGQKLTKAQAEKLQNDRYLFDLNKRYDIDGNYEWNSAGFINHSCNPNAEAEVIRGHVWITAIRNIDQNEEITYNYGYGLDDYKDFPCACGAKSCVGFILKKSLWKKIV